MTDWGIEQLFGTKFFALPVPTLAVTLVKTFIVFK